MVRSPSTFRDTPRKWGNRSPNHTMMQRCFVPFSLLSLLTYCFILNACESSTCSKTVPCPGYDGTILDAWFPYHNNEQILFKDSANEYEAWNLQLQDSTVPYSYNSGGFNAPVSGCNSTKSFYSNTVKDTNNITYIPFSISLMNQTPSYSDSTIKSVSFYFNDISYYSSYITANGVQYFNLYGDNYEMAQVIPTTLTNYSLNGVVYPLAQSIMNDSILINNANGVYEVTYAKNAGIIEYKSNPGNITWIKQ